MGCLREPPARCRLKPTQPEDSRRRVCGRACGGVSRLRRGRRDAGTDRSDWVATRVARILAMRRRAGVAGLVCEHDEADLSAEAT